MSYRFFSTSVEQLAREGERRARLAAAAEPLAAQIPPGRPPESLPRRLRRRRRPELAPRSVPPPPPAAVIALTRLAFGPAPGEVAAFNALGASAAERLAAWVDQQLDPASIDDSAADARIAQSGFVTLDKSLEQLWADHIVAPDLPWEDRIRPTVETELATFLRAIHSRRQLLEVMVDFWHNHFNVYAYDWPIMGVWAAHDRDVIRPNALGNFRQLLEAVATSPAMLHYLDNRVNSSEDPNENYAREMLELHTLGSAAYFGSLPPGQVPVVGGMPAGYVEDDVVAAARCLTGWTVSDRPWDPSFGNSGAFLYHDPSHDHDPKHVLGADLPANQPPMQDGRDLLDLLAAHPATARHIATKLARRLLADFPPQAVVDQAAAVFTAQQGAPDQIAQVVRAIVTAPQFLATWGQKVKRPLEIAVSAFRGAGGDLPFREGDAATDWFRWQYYQTGQPLFSWHPPNGYPDFTPAWNSTSPRVMSWRLANMLIQVADPAGDFYFDVLGQTPAGVRSARALVDFWTQRILGHLPPAAEHDELVVFMAQGHNPDFDLPLDTDQDTQDRLRTLVALIFQSPAFLWR